jgi:7-cyano-7-deazaguanine synthase
MGGKGTRMKRAVVLMSGGLDSTVTLAIALGEGYDVHGLTFDYGQRHRREIRSAKKVADHFDIKHKIIRIDLTQIGGSALTDDIAVPQGKTLKQIRASKEIPLTYVPARNTILLSYALGFAETIGADAIFIGANHVDYSGYPDCRPEYFQAFQKVAELGTKCGVQGRPVEIRTPIIALDKRGIVEKGRQMKVPFEFTWSCYEGGGKACGRCDSCVLRLNGFREAGVEDPLDYEAKKA